MKFTLNNFQLISIPVSFQVAWGYLGYSRHVILNLQCNDYLGTGEGVLYKTTHLQSLSIIEKDLIPWLQKNSYLNISDLRQQIIDRYLNIEPAIVFAIDTALYDIESQMKSISLIRLLKGKNEKLKITEEVFIEDASSMKKKIDEVLNHKTEYLKVKVGRNVKRDIEIVNFINDYSSHKLKLKLDFNRGYTIPNFLSFISKVTYLPIDSIEEPIQGSFSEISKLTNMTSIPIMLDESILTLSNLKEAIDAKCFHILNLKLTRLGGITMAKKYEEVCRKSKIKVSLGCSEELDIGMNAILQFASSVNDLYGVEGIGAIRLGLSSYHEIVNGKVTVPQNQIVALTAFNSKSGTINYPLHPKPLFQAYEFAGIWKTRLQNVLLKGGIHL